MGCRRCYGTGIVQYYHDAGDHFGAGTASGSEWLWVKCECVAARELRCKFLSGEFGCACKDKPAYRCRFHPKYYGDCKHFKFESRVSARKRNIKEELMDIEDNIGILNRRKTNLQKELAALKE